MILDDVTEQKIHCITYVNSRITYVTSSNIHLTLNFLKKMN